MKQIPDSNASDYSSDGSQSGRDDMSTPLKPASTSKSLPPTELASLPSADGRELVDRPYSQALEKTCDFGMLDEGGLGCFFSSVSPCVGGARQVNRQHFAFGEVAARRAKLCLMVGVLPTSPGGNMRSKDVAGGPE